MDVLAQRMTIFDQLRPLACALELRAMPRRTQVLPAFMSKQVVDARRFSFKAPTKRSEQPVVVCGGWERVGPDYLVRRRGFRFYGIEFVAGGRGTLRMGRREFPLSRGVVFAYGPDVPHEITTDARDRLSKYFVDFSGVSAAAGLRRAGVAPGTCHAVAAADEVQTAFERLLAAGRRGTPTAMRIAALEGEILLLVLSEVRLPRAARQIQSRETFLKCRDFLEKNFATVQTAEAAAAACGVAPAYFSRLFRRFAGEPAYRFLMRLKMNHAAALLERQGFNVSEAAGFLGMDAFHFSRAFKRVHGCPPILFRSAREAASTAL